jgi:hypothetical protein
LVYRYQLEVLFRCNLLPPLERLTHCKLQQVYPPGKFHRTQPKFTAYKIAQHCDPLPLRDIYPFLALLQGVISSNSPNRSTSQVNYKRASCCHVNGKLEFGVRGAFQHGIGCVNIHPFEFLLLLFTLHDNNELA